ncbi:unnamed protein product [Didymodactylos carnosus]|uniref:Uncharacterized protein n=1 Tax=Didymodactylos carnosus TaxID=1234261 RepID=A0A815DS06_9BILA|nr:unnamed protein product [Didymodactylos carnosus]CAF1304882.1 unnamed protein product [Didymodactylos carnosus]CAF3846935.1 unnamed protein product [Didymodactylos carnosus]CAF4136117.1 unnamed protein product [Didymodactylos carnosus]
MAFVHMTDRIEFMNLAYLILLNEKTPKPTELVQQLLHVTSLMQGDIDGRNITGEVSICLQLLSNIMQTIYQYFQEKDVQNATLMVDIQQWITATLKASIRVSRDGIICLSKFLNQPTCHLSLPMKQFLFEELSNIYIETFQQNRIGANRQFTYFWDRICLLSIIMDCLPDPNLDNL